MVCAREESIRSKARQSTPSPIPSRADILIIGGGLAGMYAALKAHEGGARVVIASKGPLGRSGGSIFAPSFHQALKPEWLGHLPRPWDASERFFVATYQGLMAEGPLRRADVWTTNEALPELERMGLYFHRASQGPFKGQLLHDPAMSAWAPKMDMSGRTTADLLRRKVLDAGIEVLDEVMATSLLVNDGQCVGGTFLNILNGDFFAVRSRATILATGHSNYLSKRSNGTRDVCGDGIALLYRAGAELFNVEMANWRYRFMAWPRSWMRLGVNGLPELARDETGRLVGPDRRLWFENSLVNVPPSDGLLCRKLPDLAHAAGNASRSSVDGGSYRDLSYHDQFFRHLGLDASKDLIELAHNYHHLHGGAWVDPLTFESRTLRCLFAAGGAIGHTGIGQCLYDGKCAAEIALGRIESTAMEELDAAAPDQETERVVGLLRTAGTKSGIRPQVIKTRIREIMWAKMNHEKDGATMESALEDVLAVRYTLAPNMALPSATRRFNSDWVDALDVYNMLDAVELEIRASLLRQESRGGFYRSDYPHQDDANWLKHIIVSQVGGELRMRTEGVPQDDLGEPTNA